MKRYRVKVEGKVYEVEVEEIQTEGEHLPTEPPKRTKPTPDTVPGMKSTPSPFQQQTSAMNKNITAPMAGTVISVQAKEGLDVQEGDLLLLLEAMKMENEITAPFQGRVTAIRVNPQQTVESGQILIEME